MTTVDIFCNGLVAVITVTDDNDDRLTSEICEWSADDGIWDFGFVGPEVTPKMVHLVHQLLGLDPKKTRAVKCC